MHCFDFTQSDGGWTAVYPTTFYRLGFGWKGYHDGVTRHTGADFIFIAPGGTPTISSVFVTFNTDHLANGSQRQVFLTLRDTTVAAYPIPDGTGPQEVTATFDHVVCDTIFVQVDTNAPGANATISMVVIAGTGANPFGG